MKYLISEEQLTMVLEAEDELTQQYQIVKRFLEEIPPRFPNFVKGIEVIKPKFGDQILVNLTVLPQTPSFKIEEVLDILWERIYDYLNIPVGVKHEVLN